MEAIEARVITGLNHISWDHVTIVGLIIHPENVRHTIKNAFTVINKVTFHNFVISSNVVSLLDPV